MKEFEYKPKEHFVGSVKIRIPRQKESLALLKSTNFKTDAEGKIDMDSTGKLDFAEKLNDAVEKHVVTVALKHEKSGIEFASLEDLEYCQEGRVLIAELGNLILGGFSLGNA